MLDSEQAAERLAGLLREQTSPAPAAQLGHIGTMSIGAHSHVTINVCCDAVTELLNMLRSPPQGNPDG